MGTLAIKVKHTTKRKIRATRLSAEERAYLAANAAYEGSAHHKANAGDFDLDPPSAPRPDKTLCDLAGVFERAVANTLFQRALQHGLVSEKSGAGEFPKQLWVVDEQGRVFEAMYGGSRAGRYHGYPIRRTDPFFDKIRKLWDAQ